MQVTSMKVGDLFPRPRLRLQADGVGVDLSEAVSVTARVRLPGSTSHVDRDVTVADQDVTANHGIVTVVLIDGDTDFQGTIKFDIEVEWATGVQTWPSRGYFKIWLLEDADSAQGGGPPLVGSSGDPFTLDRIYDVNISSVADNDLLQYDSTSARWLNVAPADVRSTLGLGSAALSSTTDFIRSSVTQAGAALTPTAQTLWSFQPADTNRGPFQWVMGGAAFDSVFDPVMYLGYNVTDGGGVAKSGEASFRTALESHYRNGGVNNFEYYFEYMSGDLVTRRRPFFLQMDKSTGAVNSMQFSANTAYFTQESDEAPYFTISRGNITSAPYAGTPIEWRIKAASAQNSVFTMENSTSVALTVETLSTNSAVLRAGSVANENLYLFNNRGIAVNVQDNAAALTVKGGAVGPVAVFRAGSVAGNLTTWQDNASSVLASVSSAGLATFAGLTLSDATNMAFGTTTGTKIGTATSQKLGFYNATPIIRPSGSILTALSSLGLVGSPTLASTALSDTATLAYLNAANTFTAQQFIDGSSDQIQLRVQGHSTQTSSIQTWEDSSANVIARIGSSGFFASAGGFGNPSAGNPYILPASGSLTALSQNAAHIPWTVKGAASQSANLQTWVDSASTTLASVSAAGLGTFAGLTSTANITTAAGYVMIDRSGDATHATIYLQRDAGGGSNQIIGRTGSSHRWMLRIGNPTAETGTNAGSDLDFLAYQDDGATYATPLTITRASGAAKFTSHLATGVPMTVKGATSQSANLTEWQSSAAAVLASISAAGLGTFNDIKIDGSNLNLGLGYLTHQSTSGTYNIALGYLAQRFLTTGTYCMAIGSTSNYFNQTGTAVTAIGYNAAKGASGNSHSGGTYIGYSSGSAITTGANNIALGFASGAYSTNQSYELFINSIDRTNRAGDIAKSIIYGVQAAAPEDQTLTFNASVAIGGAASLGGGKGVAFIANANTVPTTDPSGGGILYVESGALKFRGSSGTVTTVAPA